MSCLANYLDDDQRLTHTPTAGMHHAPLGPKATAPTPVVNRPRTVSAFALAAEDHAEDTGWLESLDRLTCRVHSRWIHECGHSDLHVIPVTGHRWCRPCRRPLEIAVDELTRTVTLHCPRCDRGPTTRADHQLIAACEASLTAARAHRRAAGLAA
jgi:hypothetical protein